MRNQTSFRLTTTLRPNDTTAQTTTVINKVDEGGNKYYPTFNEETVVITNDDRTMMETTRASCNNGTITFTKRGLSDDGMQTQIENRKLSWNPGSLCFITIGAGDIIDTGDDLYWNGEQTFEGNAVFNGMLETHKGVKYPTFPSLADLQAYEYPFAGMFAVLDSDGELYRYNAETEQWDVVTTSTPVQPEKASTIVIGTVRGADATEFANGVDTGSSGELLVTTPAQVKSIVTPRATTSVIGAVRASTTTEFNNGTATGSGGEYLITTPAQVQGLISGAGLHVTHIGEEGEPRLIYNVNEETYYTYTVTRAGFIVVDWVEWFTSTSISAVAPCNSVTTSGTASVVCAYSWSPIRDGSATDGQKYRRRALYAVGPGTVTFKNKINYTLPSSQYTWISVEDYFYFG